MMMEAKLCHLCPIGFNDDGAEIMYLFLNFAMMKGLVVVALLMLAYTPSKPSKSSLRGSAGMGVGAARQGAQGYHHDVRQRHVVLPFQCQGIHSVGEHATLPYVEWSTASMRMLEARHPNTIRTNFAPHGKFVD